MILTIEKDRDMINLKIFKPSMKQSPH